MDTKKRIKPVYTTAQQDYIITQAGFTELEEKIFRLKMKDESNIQIALTVNKCERMISAYLKNMKQKMNMIEKKDC